MRAARYLLAALALLLVACAAVWFIAPAALAVTWLDDASHGALQLYDASGTLHDGHGRIGDRAGRWSIPVAWSLDAGMLWRGMLVVRLGSATDSVHATLRVSRNGVDASDVDVSIPAAVATSMLPPMIALNAGGTVVVTSDAIALGDQARGSARARWSPARLADAGGNALDFGTVSVDFRTADDGSATVTMAGAGGDTMLDGNARVVANRIDADLALAPRTGAPLPLLQSLAAFGAAQPGGGARFGYHGEWSRAHR